MEGGAKGLMAHGATGDTEGGATGTKGGATGIEGGATGTKGGATENTEGDAEGVTEGETVCGAIGDMEGARRVASPGVMTDGRGPSTGTATGATGDGMSLSMEV